MTTMEGLLTPMKDIDYDYIAGGYAVCSGLCVLMYFIGNMVETLGDVWLVVRVPVMALSPF
jgi:hypothetical protein